MSSKLKVFSLTAERSRFCCMAISPRERIVALRGSGSGVAVGSGVSVGTGVASSSGCTSGMMSFTVTSSPPKGCSVAMATPPMTSTSSTPSVTRPRGVMR